MNDLAANINHLDILHAMVFFKLAEGYIRRFVCSDSFFEVRKGADGIFVLVIWTPEL
jgi:hypothetical protein